MNHRLQLALQLLSFILFGLILWWAGPEAWQQLFSGDYRPLSVGFVLHGLAGFVSGIRLRLVAQAVAGRQVASWRRFYYLNMMARALGLVLPRSLSAVGGKSVGLRTIGISLKRSVWTVVIDNVFDVLLLGVLSVTAVLFFRTEISTTGFWLLSGLFVAILAFGIGWMTRAGRLSLLFAWAQQLPWLARKLKLEPDSAATLFPATGPSLKVLAWTVVLNGLLASNFYFIGLAVGVPVPWLLVVASFPIAQLSLIVAIAPGGLGIFDLGWLGLLRLGGLSQESALTFVVAQRAYISIFVLVWAAFSGLLSLTEKRFKFSS